MTIASNQYAFGAVTVIADITIDTCAGESVFVIHGSPDICDTIQTGAPVLINGIWYTFGPCPGGCSGFVSNGPIPDTMNGITISQLVPSFFNTSDIPVSEPWGKYNPYSKALPLATGGVRAGGWKLAQWDWGFITQAERECLRSILSIPSTDPVYILTRIYDDADLWQWYTGVALWPPLGAEDRQTTRRLAFSLKFQRLQQLSCFTFAQS